MPPSSSTATTKPTLKTPAKTTTGGGNNATTNTNNKSTSGKPGSNTTTTTANGNNNSSGPTSTTLSTTTPSTTSITTNNNGYMGVNSVANSNTSAQESLARFGDFDYVGALRLLYSDEHGVSCIHLAAKNSAPAHLIESLIAAGLNPDTKTPDGITGLHLLVLDEDGNGNPALVKVLVENGANPNYCVPLKWKKKEPYFCKMPNDLAGCSPLMLAVKSGSPNAADFTRYLVICGADVKFRHTVNGKTAQDMARDAGLTELVALLEPGATIPTLPVVPAECAYCRVVTPSLKACTKCRMVKYCGEQCQKLHWADHRSLCKQIAGANADPDAF
jgi:hypothetical protein